MPHFEHNSDKFGYINLESMAGVQKALNSLGHDAGTADGKDGPKTQHAVREFQASLRSRSTASSARKPGSR